MHQPTGQRVIVIGASNAGKSTLAERLATRLNVPFVDLDALHWESGWVEAELPVFHERIRAAVEPDAWVMAGNYFQKQQDISWPRADTIVFLDLSLPIILKRCIRRSWRRWRSHEPLYGGENRENFFEHLMFWDTDKSLIAHIIKTHPSRRRNFDRMSRDPRWAHLTFVRLCSVDEVEAWLARVGRDSPAVNDLGVQPSVPPGTA
ncbi:MAG TPA: shikimate kinase [Thermomicrobiales bacterium]|nr:shikimate kinase [Thermomicrobiales bacterium]